MKTIIVTIGSHQFVAESLKKANAVIEALHTADLKPFRSLYIIDESNDFRKIHEWEDMANLQIKVEIKTDFEIANPLNQVFNTEIVEDDDVEFEIIKDNDK